MTKELKKSIIITYLIAVPIGLVVILTVLIIPFLLSGEPIFISAIFLKYSYSIFGLILSFILSLWFGGKLIYNNLISNESLIYTSFKFSLFINTIIWSVFLLTQFVRTGVSILDLLLIVSIFIICTIITPFTIGLLIVSLIRKTLN